MEIKLTATEKALNQMLDCAREGALLWEQGKKTAALVRFDKAVAGLKTIRYVGYTKQFILSSLEHHLADVIQIQAECGGLDYAIDLLKTIGQHYPRFRALMVLAPVLVSSGQVRTAEGFVRGHKVMAEQAYLKAELAIAP